MKFRTWIIGRTFSLLVVLLFAISTAYAAPIRVDCGRGGSINSTLASLASAGNTRGITIFVTGTCKENIFIYPFDHLTLQAAPIATIQDVSNGTLPTVQIFSSNDVTLTGFTINGGAPAVNCEFDSSCTLYLSTIQGAADGVRFGSSHGRVFNCTVSNNSARGIVVVNGSSVSTSSNTVSGNGAAGIVVSFGSNLAATADTIQNNAIGVQVGQGSLRASDLTITGNNSDGVLLIKASAATFFQVNTGNVIIGNGGNGVSVNDLSFAEFDGMNNVSGNLTQPDVACNPQYSATRGAGTVGGTTNCVEPPKSQQLLSHSKADGPPDRP
jgi:parallel beta-helix repeat protein